MTCSSGVDYQHCTAAVVLSCIQSLPSLADLCCLCRTLQERAPCSSAHWPTSSCRKCRTSSGSRGCPYRQGEQPRMGLHLLLNRPGWRLCTSATCAVAVGSCGLGYSQRGSALGLEDTFRHGMVASVPRRPWPSSITFECLLRALVPTGMLCTRS